MRAGEVVRVDFGVPQGSEPGFVRPAVVVTADRVLAAGPRTLHVVPITSNTARRLPTELDVETDDQVVRGMAQAHLCAVVSTSRVVGEGLGSIGLTALTQIRSVISDLLDLP